MSGWIKLHRKMIDWEWWDEPNTVRLFLVLLMKTNHKDTSYKGVQIKAGQLKTGRKQLSDWSGLSEMKVRTALNNLLSTNEITINPTTKYSIISITNWSEHQQDNQQDNQRITNKQPTDNQRITTSKNVKNVKNVNIDETDFNIFWENYPLKKKRKDSLKAFLKATKGGVNLDIIIEGLKVYKKHKPDWQDFAHASTWLNGECWNDEYKTKKKITGWTSR